MDDDDGSPSDVLEEHFHWDEEETEPPRKGMTFTSEKEAYNFYKKYAASMGFGIRRSNTKIGGDRRLKYFSIACTRSRKPTTTSKTRKNSSIRTDCKAKINLIVDSDRILIVSKVRLDHNHPLSLVKEQSAKTGMAERNGGTSGGCNRSVRSVSNQDEGNEGLQSLERRQFRCYIQNHGHLPLGDGDAEALQDFFFQMQRKDANFFYMMDLNEEGRLRNVFWVDGRCRALYETFGDVVLIDTTYLVDKFNLPLVPFVGVNHHGHSILFGCSLLSNEDAETYIWLFRSWLACMRDRIPKAIIMDTSRAIQDAVFEVLPTVRRRICLRHIVKKLPEMLGGFAQYQEIKKSFECSIYESFYPDEFEGKWKIMIEDYHLQDNMWLRSLYLERHFWVPVFVRETFWAGLSMAQRSDDVEAFFDDCTTSKTTLKQFLEQYDNVMKSKVEIESNADFVSTKTSIQLVSDLSIEKQFREVYTHDVFKLFQEELKGLLYCNTSLIKADGSVSTYEVTNSMKLKNDRSRHEVCFKVLYNEDDCQVHCACHLFEFRGIICRHAIAVLMKKNVNEIPYLYILPRWRKDIKRNYTLVKTSYDDSNVQMNRYDQLCKHFCQVAELGVKSLGKYTHLMKFLDEAKEYLLENDFVCEDILQQDTSSFMGLDEHLATYPTSEKRKGLLEQTNSRKKTMDNAPNLVTGIDTGIKGSHHHFLRYHYIQMYPNKHETQDTRFSNSHTILQKCGLGTTLQHPAIFLPNGPNFLGFVSGRSVIKPHNGNHDSSQTTNDVESTSVPVTMENPSNGLAMP